MRKRFISWCWCTIFVLSCFHGIFAEDTGQSEEQVALSAAQAWLKVMDDGRYEQSWGIAGIDIKEKLTQELWVWILKEDSEAFGKIISRRLKEKNYFNSVPDFPNGEYFMFTFASSLEDKDSAEEIITMKKEKDGQWRLYAYVIGPTDEQRVLMMKQYQENKYLHGSIKK